MFGGDFDDGAAYSWSHFLVEQLDDQLGYGSEDRARGERAVSVDQLPAWVGGWRSSTSSVTAKWARDLRLWDVESFHSAKRRMHADVAIVTGSVECTFVQTVEQFQLLAVVEQVSFDFLYLPNALRLQWLIRRTRRWLWTRCQLNGSPVAEVRERDLQEDVIARIGRAG